MSTPQRTGFQADEWVEEKIAEGKVRARECRAELEGTIVRNPLAAVAIGIGVGYLARSLPLARIAGGLVRVGVSFAPHLLLGIGAARAWHCLKNEGDAIGSLPKLPQRREASAPGVTVFPGQ